MKAIVVMNETAGKAGMKLVDNVSTLDDAVAAFHATERHVGKTIIRVRPRGPRKDDRFCPHR